MLHENHTAIFYLPVSLVDCSNSHVVANNMISAGEFIAAFANSGLHPTGAQYLFYRLLGNTLDTSLNQQAFDSSITFLDSNGEILD